MMQLIGVFTAAERQYFVSDIGTSGYNEDSTWVDIGAHQFGASSFTRWLAIVARRVWRQDQPAMYSIVELGLDFGVDFAPEWGAYVHDKGGYELTRSNATAFISAWASTSSDKSDSLFEAYEFAAACESAGACNFIEYVCASACVYVRASDTPRSTLSG